MSPRKGDKRASSPQSLVPAEDKTGSNPTLSSDAYNKVAKQAKLQGIYLVASTFKMSTSQLLEQRKSGRSRKLSYGAKVEDFQFDAEEGIATCNWEWNVSELVKGKKALSIVVNYTIIYDGLKECEEEGVVRFIRRVGRFATYPYFRAHVSQINWESGADLPIMPTISS